MIPQAKSVVLVGGGHSHAIVMRKLAMKPIQGVNLTLVSDVTHTPYSGMLPAMIAGIYSYDEAHIDLRRLCQASGVRFVRAQVIGVNLATRKLQLADRPVLGFDYLSLNIGSTPLVHTTPGAEEFATRIKPVSHFLKKWEQVVEAYERCPSAKLVIVGGGAGGVELALAARAKLGPQAKISLIHKGEEIMPTHNKRVRSILTRELKKRGIELHLQEKVVEVGADQLRCYSGKMLDHDYLFWLTQATAPSWIAQSGLAVDSQKFLLVDETLKSVSHPFVFGAGDIATLRGAERPKSGVFAVRQGKPLYQNLRAVLQGTPLKPYRPQKNFLGLIGNGHKQAVASRGELACFSRSMWWLKDYIDRKFMRQFAELPVMLATRSSTRRDAASLPELRELLKKSDMRCVGCASKIGFSLLQNVLTRIEDELLATETKEVSINLKLAEDATLIDLPHDHSLVQSIDFFPVPVSDLFVSGRIALVHALSDIYAMGATPHSVLALLLTRFAHERVMSEDLFQMLAGVAVQAKAEGCSLRGGHSSEGDYAAIGIAANGILKSGQEIRKRGLAVGEQLILSKPVGVGAILAASMRGAIPGRCVDVAIESMLISNRKASKVFRKYGVSAMTDITGFGLLGHLLEMLEPSEVSAELSLEAIPYLRGALESFRQNLFSSQHAQNLDAAKSISGPSRFNDNLQYHLLFDPQTSGGLLGGVSAQNAMRCLEELRAVGCEHAAIVGKVTNRKGEALVDLTSGSVSQ